MARALTTPVPGQVHRDLTFSTGFRRDNLDWNIANDMAWATNPNILSELEWSNVDSFIFSGTGRFYIEDVVYMRGTFDWGLVFDGTNRDSDYKGDDRTLEYSRSENLADEGSVWDVSGGVSYFILRPAPTVAIAPLVGISYHKQNLTLTDGQQVVARTDLEPLVHPLGPIVGLDSTYDASWFGPWVGVDIFWAAERFRLTGSAEYHYAWFNAKANWNLRDDFAHPVSFEQWAQGQGVEFSVAADYNIMERLSAGATVEGGFWQAWDGTDRIYWAGGGGLDTRFNEVNWDHLAVMLALTYTY